MIPKNNKQKKQQTNIANANAPLPGPEGGILSEVLVFCFFGLLVFQPSAAQACDEPCLGLAKKTKKTKKQYPRENSILRPSEGWIPVCIFLFFLKFKLGPGCFIERVAFRPLGLT